MTPPPARRPGTLPPPKLNLATTRVPGSYILQTGQKAKAWQNLLRQALGFPDVFIACGTCSGSSGEGETEAEWVMRITWTLADDLLAGVASWTDRLPILERLVPIDLPVPGGSGAEQYRYAPPSHHISDLGGGTHFTGFHKGSLTRCLVLHQWKPRSGICDCKGGMHVHYPSVKLSRMVYNGFGNVTLLPDSYLVPQGGQVLCLPACRQALLLYELFEGRADQYLVWSCQEDTSSTSGRIKTEAALQTLIADHSWAKASRYGSSALSTALCLIR